MENYVLCTHTNYRKKGNIPLLGGTLQLHIICIQVCVLLYNVNEYISQAQRLGSLLDRADSVFEGNPQPMVSTIQIMSYNI